METSDDEHGMKPLLLARDDNLNENRVVGLLKARKWFIVFGCALVLAVIIVVCFVATKSSSSSHCYSYSDSDDCFFKGITRLPKTLKPLTYEVQLQPNLTTFVFNGSVLIVVKCLETTNRVVFHQKGLSFDHTEVSYYEKLKGSSKGRKKLLAIDEMRLDSENEQVIWKMTESLEKGKEYSIAVSFHGKLNDKLEGFYKSSYKTYENGETRYRYLATTHFEATTARQAFPCFDEPAMKANFTIIMVHEIEYVALSNMPVESSIILDNKLNKTKFRESVKMSTYLVAFVVCDFAYVSATTERGVQIRIWAPKDQINETKLAADSARFILNYYEQYFHINYPLPKQDLIAIPDFSAGAMENWGLITYRLTALLSDDNESSDSNKQWVATVVAHELAHQWFGNLVTMKWWSDLWLNEGFASYMENVGVNQFRPRWKMMDQFVVTNVHRSMRLDQLANSHPISVVVKNPSEISSLFDDISYHKGASLIRMMSSVLGDEVFHHGLQSYLKQYAFSNAATDDLWHSLSENTTIDVKEVMDTWTRQMGFPLVTIQKEKDGRYLATQEHFLVNPDAKPALESPYNYKWHIPLTYRTNKDKADTSSSVTWMHRQDVHINVDLGKDDWLKANHGQIGFYRVNYPFDNWQKLANTLRNGHETLLPADRAGLIDDAFTLARAGKLNYTTPLEISLYLNKEFEYVPWSTAMSSLSYIGARLSMTPFYGLYQTYILSRVKPILKEIGYRDEGDNLRKYLRDILFGTATAYDYKPAVVEAQRMFSDFMSNSKRVPPNFRYTVYDSGVRQGAKAEWEFMWNKYERETVASEKRKLLSSLSNTREAWLLQRLLEYSLNSSLIKSQDADSVISSVAGNPNGRLLAWDFVRLNWDTLRNRYGSEAFSFGRLIKAVTAHFQTEFHYTEVKAFFDAHPDVGSAKRSLEQAFEAIRSNIRWVKEHQDDVVHWLRQQH